MRLRSVLPKGLYNLISNSPPKTERLLALFLATVISVLMAVVLSVMSHNIDKDLSDHYKDTYAQKAVSIINQITRYLEVRDLQIEIESQNPILLNNLLNPNEKSNQLTSFLQNKKVIGEHYPQVLITRKGKVIYVSDNIEEPEKLHFNNIHQESMAQHTKRLEQYSFPILLDLQARHWIIQKPIYSDSEYIGLLLTYIPINRMSEKLELKHIKGLQILAELQNGETIAWGASKATNWKTHDLAPYQIQFKYGIDLSSLNDSLKDAQIQLVVSVLFIALVSIGLSIIIGRWFFVRPLEKLQAFASDINKGKDNDLTETKRITIEIQMLSNTISKMATDIHKREKDLIETNLALKRNQKALLNTNIALKQNQDTLLKSEKMAGLGQVTAGVAHEINNPIGFIMNNLSTLKEYHHFIKALIEQLLSLMNGLSDEEKQAHQTILDDIKKTLQKEQIDFVIDDLDCLIDESLKGTERVKDITSGLKGYAHAGEQKSLLDINECIEATLKVVWNELKYNCTVEKDFKPLPPVECIGGQINQVFMNLFINASHAMVGKKGELSIQTYAIENDVFIIISDNGCGIKRDDLTRIFEPFYTTKPLGEGTGLGMSISFDIIKQHGGEIQVESEVGFGTSFMIKLPVAK